MRWLTILQVDRVNRFQDIARENELKPLSLEDVQGHVRTFVHQHDEALDEVKKTRRPGRPASAKEDLLKLKVAALTKEYENGFCMSMYSTYSLSRLV